MVEKKKLLIVDDDPYIIIAIRTLFEEEGFEVFAANSGIECLDFLEKENFNGVILIDLMMPIMTGWETIDEIVKRGLNEKLIISVLSAKDIPNEKSNTMRYITDYLNKPFENNELMDKVNSYFAYE
ncbi:response regulator [Thermoplasmatales archaeon ex4572_165]|nr:MAG: response regulator [Thermoplasmatales archaeon ex4572_165]